MSASRNRLAFVLAAGALLPAALVAQQSTGSLAGRIVTADGVTPKAGVVVTVIQKVTNLTRRAVSDEEGNWRTPALPVGDYRITLSSGGQTQVINRTVNLGMDTLVRFKWPAEAGATVVVEAFGAGVDQVNTSSAEVGVTVDSQVLVNLPVLDRNVNSAAVLAPGVQIIQGAQVDPTKKTSTYIVSGDGQGRGTNFNVDGADNNSSDVGGYVLPIPIDAIDQFQVVTNQYKADYGRSNAGFLNVVTKSGGNEFLGTVNYQFTNQALRARKTDESPKLDNDSSQYAFMVSGPILKDRLFFMVAGEKEATNVTQTFDARAIAVYPALANTQNKLKKMNLYTKFDWIVSENFQASFKYARYYDQSADQTFPHADAVAEYVDPSMLGTNRDSTTAYGVKLTGTFGNVVWESTFNTFDYVNSIRPSAAGQNMGSGLELRSRHTAASDAWRMGSDPNAYQNTGVKRTQWKNDITWAVGEHSLKGGVDWQRTEYPLEQYFFATPTVYVIGIEPTAGFTDAWSQSFSSANISRLNLAVPIVNPPTTFNGYGIYVQDEWTVNPKWSVYAGFRLDWDTQLDYYTKFDSLYAQMHAANPLLAGIGDKAPRTHHYSSPRVQVLYKPNGDDVLTFKLGYGKFVASTIDNVVGFSRSLDAKVNGLPASYINQNDSGTAFLQGVTLTTVNGHPIVLPAELTPYNYANNVGGLRDLFEKTIAGYLTTASFETGGKQLLASDFVYPTTESLTLGMTYKFSERSALDVTLAYSKTKHQTVQFTTDGSNAHVWSNGDAAHTVYVPWSGSDADGNANAYSADTDLGDNIFLSNQTSSSRQIQVKYTFHTDRMHFLATFVGKSIRSSMGGDGGAFDQNGGADFYGAGAQPVWETAGERLATGTEAMSGSFAWDYAFTFGTKVGLLGQWHSGKYYDTYLGYAPHNYYSTTKGAYDDVYGSDGGTTLDNPNPVIGTAKGAWNMDLGLRISHTIRFARKMILEPYIQIQNILNNYDYGTNYDTNLMIADDSHPDVGIVNSRFKQRNAAFQTNSPRTAAVGVRFTW